MTSPHPHLSTFTPEDLDGANVVDAEGNKVGAVQKVYRDDSTGDPEWVTVRTGLFGTKETFVPLAGATRTDNGLRVPHSKDLIKDAPRIDVDGHLDRSEEGTLYRHYGLTGPGDHGRAASNGFTSTGRHAAGAAGTGMAASGRTRSDSGHSDISARSFAGTGTSAREMAGAGAPTRSGDPDLGRGRHAAGGKEQMEEILLSEERLDIATEEHESGRAELRKRVVTEDVTKSVEVSHEEVRVTRVPITEEERRMGRTHADIGEEKVEVILHEERAVMRKETVPVERVRLEVYKVTEQQEVSGQVRKEEIEFDDGIHAKHANTREGYRDDPRMR
ncbi:PRC and DUF2382 domain-containing protein [Streptomyces candidus]|uniref:Uncharacterized protein (TIGR02271 family) n=1 Tax=Streptomyces candidus TaxID=67283 RepID=A0A7X0LRK0_9ACTN|nr:PRC and DUF2382 domain-containing protein [Streptomyces candidus]MBB6438192.1 uncharacterized protein (TIGR02271 family) [Streptomyces candidus]GHH38974.1 photosystem reaction center subunit H [Streptomyces candidus]